MIKDEALRIVSRECPCDHESHDANLGNGQIWAKCHDCGVTFDRARHERIRESARKFSEAIDVLRGETRMTKAQRQIAVNVLRSEAARRRVDARYAKERAAERAPRSIERANAQIDARIDNETATALYAAARELEGK